MRKRINVALIILSFLFAIGQVAFAQNITIDDFTTGGSEILMYRSGSQNPSQQTGDPLHLIGGLRAVNIDHHHNPENQISTFQFRPDSALRNSAFFYNAAFDAGPRADIVYGSKGGINLDLSSYHSDPNGVIRLKFRGLTQSLAFVVYIYSSGYIGAYNACDIPPASGQFVVDVPLSKFWDGGINWNDVTNFWFILYSNSYIGAQTFALSSIEVSNTPYPGAISCSFP